MVGLLGGALVLGLTVHVGAWAIVRAPNFDGPPPSASPPDDVQAVVRAEVGQPTATLEAWVLEPAAPRGTTLVLHGIRDHKESMLGLGRALRARGQRAVLVDLRGYRASSGRFLTYGVRDARDVMELIDRLDADGRLTDPVNIYGPSYGGAVALQAAALCPRIERVVSVSTFASLRAVVPPYAARVVPVIGTMLPGALLDLVIDHSGRIGGFSPEEASPADAIGRTPAELLLVHGTEDDNIPFTHAQRLVDACAPGSCRLLPIEGADHHGALSSETTIDAALDFLAPIHASSLSGDTAE